MNETSSGVQKFSRIRYQELNSRQQENYNFQKISAVLADYGYATIRLSADWQGADFIAQHLDGLAFLKVQLKGRASFDRKYLGRGIYICFQERKSETWYLYPHDEVLASLLESSNIAESKFWQKNGFWHFPYLTKKLQSLLEPYRLHQ